MKPDIEYWKAGQGMTIEPQTTQGRKAFIDKFPLYETGKLFKAYVASTGLWRWEFFSASSGLEALSGLNVSIGEKIAS